jgi:hypothetical protein
LNETDPSTKWNVGYRIWAKEFQSGMSGMQYGYDDADGGPSDKLWWSKLDDPQKEIGDSCIQVSTNTRFLIWADFTAQNKDLDWSFTGTSGSAIKSNYLNNSSMSASINIKNQVLYVDNKKLLGNSATIKIFNLDGKLLQSKSITDVNNGVFMNIGNNISKGVYLIKVKSGNQTLSNRMTIN